MAVPGERQAEDPFLSAKSPVLERRAEMSATYEDRTSKADSSLRDELMQCFREWTRQQAAALKLLSAQHQAQLDQACRTILTALETRDGMGTKYASPTTPRQLSAERSFEQVALLEADPENFPKLNLQKPPQRPDILACIDDKESEPSPNSNPFLLSPVATKDKRKGKPQVDHLKATECEPIVQFSAPMYFCSENEDMMHIDVMRIGNLNGRSEVRYTTADATAFAGEKYKKTTGTLIFEPDENNKEIHVPILKTDRWETTVEFKIQLLEEGKRNCSLGFYLFHARVKIIDTDTFPTNKYDSQIQEMIDTGNHDAVPKQSLLIEYFKMSWQNPQCKRSTVRMMLADQLHNVNFLLGLFLNVYLVDYVLNKEKPDEELLIQSGKEVNLLLIVGGTLVPFAIQHVVDFIRDTWKLNAGELQRNILRKFLNYDEAARAQLQEATLILGMTRDSGNLVEGGYLQMINLAKHSGKLIMILLYQLVSPFVFGTTDSFADATFWVFSLVPLISLPLLLYVFISCRRKRASYIIADRNNKEDSLIATVFETSRNYRLIADYNRRPQTVEKFTGCVTQYMDACTDADQVITNNVYFQKWVTMLLLAMITIGLGHAVISTDYPVGMFLANVSVCASVGDCYAEIYDSLLNMEKILPQLMQVTWLMNLPTDLPHRMTLNRRKRADTNKLREEHRQSIRQNMSGEDDGDVLPIDTLNITLKDIRFAYNSKGRVTSFNFKGSIDIKQGSLVALVGHKGHGKTTVLKILGSVILPRVDQEVYDQGQWFYIPSHLRALHVSTEPLFFHGTLFENLTYGVPGKDHLDGGMDRVKTICKMLSLAPEIIGYLSDDTALDWNEVLSLSQQALLSLARALISNPEVLVIHKPTLPFDPKTASLVLQLLRSYVDDKGIEQDSNTWHLRRPRTCCVTVSRQEALQLADKIYLVEPDNVKAIQWTEVKKDLLN